MARRNDHSRVELKDMVISAARKTIEEEGAEALSARRIARDIGYAPGTIYNIFQSMGDLCFAINMETLDTLREGIASKCASGNKKTPQNLVKQFASFYIDFARGSKPFFLMLFENGGVSKPLQEGIADLPKPLEGVLEPYFPKSKKRECTLAARALWGAVHGLCFLEQTEKTGSANDNEATQDMADYLIDTFLKGLNPPPAQGSFDF